jgi:Asp-tRNA(Asn)/Glu-tRNA(Gln) amidotransferase A subunit family amidase
MGLLGGAVGKCLVWRRCQPLDHHCAQIAAVYPSLNLPSGLSADSLPFRIQLMSATLREDKLIAAGQWCKTVLDFRQRPNL